MEFINMTDHSVSIMDMKGRVIVSIPASNKVARVRSRSEKIGSFCCKNFTYRVYDKDGNYTIHEVKGNPESGGLDFFRMEYTEVEGAPETIEKGVYYIVSAMVSARINHLQVIAPGQIVRDSTGKAVGCCGISLQKYA